ncbi:hypothetical protein SaccyDRAFT_4173 [Saccharomonospora cyanea NA-134]|uniref:Uncharacterized protein n=2 Tax=Saccharomonospora cyanea TaxID=40989 RepID=H5XK39_9PSEU|nr:hypothetical protein [Saccharomonospora cyanea]EHR62994.1 hypothetical protein SaccyDRAFT_4173 [Saccharomonospora cyanea NA-134]
MGAHALGAAAVENESRWQLANLRERERSALRTLPSPGADSSGPLGPGLLSRGILGTTIREIQLRLE